MQRLRIDGLDSADKSRAPEEDSVRDRFGKKMPTSPYQLLTLRGHLTRGDLQASLQPVARNLLARRAALVVDARLMTSYDDDARALFVDWNTQHRDHIVRVAVVTERTLWRMVISAMALASQQDMRSFADLPAAQQWATQPETAETGIQSGLHVGRLSELRIKRLTLSELPHIVRAIAENRLHRSDPVVAIVDMRSLQEVDESITHRLVAAMARNNKGVLRAAILTSPQDPRMYRLAYRALQEAGSDVRRVFDQVDEARAWLAPVLDASERQRLDQFLAEP